MPRSRSSTSSPPRGSCYCHRSTKDRGKSPPRSDLGVCSTSVAIVVAVIALPLFGIGGGTQLTGVAKRQDEKGTTQEAYEDLGNNGSYQDEWEDYSSLQRTRHRARRGVAVASWAGALVIFACAMLGIRRFGQPLWRSAVEAGVGTLFAVVPLVSMQPLAPLSSYHGLLELPRYFSVALVVPLSATAGIVVARRVVPPREIFSAWKSLAIGWGAAMAGELILVCMVSSLVSALSQVRDFTTVFSSYLPVCCGVAGVSSAIQRLAER